MTTNTNAAMREKLIDLIAEQLADAILAALSTAAPAAQGDACDAKHIAALTEIVRMPNAEYVADAHNAAVKYLRLRARANQEHKP